MARTTLFDLDAKAAFISRIRKRYQAAIDPGKCSGPIESLEDMSPEKQELMRKLYEYKPKKTSKAFR